MTFDRERAHAIDVHVGARLRQLRLLLGLSQEALSVEIGRTFQQLQKYENGSNRISAGVLQILANLLQVQVAYFFDGLGQPEAARLPNLGDRQTLELVRNFYQIPEPQRARVYDLVKSLAGVVPHER